MFDAAVKLSGVSRIRLYINEDKLPLREIVAREKPDLACTGVFYTGAWKPTCHLKADGTVLADDPSYQPPGLVWDVGPDLRAETVPAPGARNYLSCCLLVHNGQPEPKLYYNADVGGKRGRAAVWLRGGELGVTAFSDGGEAMTPEGLRDYLVRDIGPDTAIMMDGGGKVNFYDAASGTMVQGREPSQNLLLIYRDEDDKNDKEDKEDKPMGQYIVKPSVGVNVRSGPGTLYPKVSGYSRGTVVTILEERDGWGRTDLGWVLLENLTQVDGNTGTDLVTDLGITVQEDFIPSGRLNRPGGPNPDDYITIHETGNFARGADAEAHGRYLRGESAEVSRVSWHFTVDDHAIVQHLPVEETAYHAGDGASGPGNATSIGIEICVNADGDFPKAKSNAASLVRLLMQKLDIPIGRVVQHNHWTGKDCPYLIRHTEGAWEAFLALCGAEDAPPETADSWAEDAWEWAFSSGLLDGTRPKDTITRQELAVVLSRLAEEV